MESLAGQRVKISELSREVGLSPSRLRQLANAGVIPSDRTPGGHRLFDVAAVRAALARRDSPPALPETPGAELGRPTWHRTLNTLGLAEDRVWQQVAETLKLDAQNAAGKIFRYAFMEMLNNAIDHSCGETVKVKLWITPDAWAFEIHDDGVGAFPKLREGLGLHSEFEAVQELSKGKRTTDPARHTGEGIFFSSKAVDLFRLTSAGLRWTVDNLRGDVALGTAPEVRGTTVWCQVDPSTDRQLGDLFRQFTDDLAFVRTRPSVKLFGLGLTFVSRSEARRFLDGLDRDFTEIEVDFAGVDDVGQGFVDELLRVWPSAHPGKKIMPINMNPAVEFMVKRGLTRFPERG